MPTEQLNGIELHYEEYGAGPPIVFLHGAGGGAQIGWFQQIPHFERHYRCIVIDHRGFGSSTDPDKEGPTRFVDDLEELLDRLGAFAEMLRERHTHGDVRRLDRAIDGWVDRSRLCRSQSQPCFRSRDVRLRRGPGLARAAQLDGRA